MSDHTPFPWLPGQGRSIVSVTGGFIAQVYDGSVDPAKLGQIGQPGGPPYDLDRESANRDLILNAAAVLAAKDAEIERLRRAVETLGQSAIDKLDMNARPSTRAAVEGTTRV